MRVPESFEVSQVSGLVPLDEQRFLVILLTTCHLPLMKVYLKSELAEMTGNLSFDLHAVKNALEGTSYTVPVDNP